MSREITMELLTENQYKNYYDNSRTIRFYRRNPSIAVKELLGIQLLDFQVLTVEMVMKSEHATLAFCRNAGKSLLSAILLMINSLLYPNEEEWIYATSGLASKKLFTYIEQLALGELESKFGTLPDLFAKEIKTSPQNVSGFTHGSSGYKFKLVGNNSVVQTLNTGGGSSTQNARGQRSTFSVGDEAGFIDDSIFQTVNPFLNTNSSFKTGGDDEFFEPRGARKNKPNRNLMISSVSSQESYFYRKYRYNWMYMAAGSKNHFCLDIKIDTPLAPYMNGKKYAPLLEKSVVDADMATNPEKAKQEYFNVWANESEDQIIKSFMIERNSTFLFPDISPVKNGKYAMFYDPAQSADNSILTIGRFDYDEKLGWIGNVANMTNFKDLKDTSKKNRQMLYQDQIERLRHYLIAYNNSDVEYENIQKLLIDSGTGGGGLLYAGTLMLDFRDKVGKRHRGVIDKVYFEEKMKDYPNAYPMLEMISPQKWRNTMVQELIDLLDLGLIRFPKLYNGSGYIDVEKPTGVFVEDEDGVSEEMTELTRRYLTEEEQLALINIDLAKIECKSIHKYKTNAGNYIYQLDKSLGKDFHDDRFYTLLMFAHHLHGLRENDKMTKGKRRRKKDSTILNLCSTRKK